MNILRTMITRTAEETTANGVFNVEYTVTDGALERITATIRKLPSSKGLPGDYLGTIVYESAAVNFNFIHTEEPQTPLVEDFERLLGIIRESISGAESAVK